MVNFPLVTSRKFYSMIKKKEEVVTKSPCISWLHLHENLDLECLKDEITDGPIIFLSMSKRVAFSNSYLALYLFEKVGHYIPITRPIYLTLEKLRLTMYQTICWLPSTGRSSQICTACNSKRRIKGSSRIGCFGCCDEYEWQKGDSIHVSF